MTSDPKPKQDCDICAPYRHRWLLHKVCNFFYLLYFIQ